MPAALRVVFLTTVVVLTSGTARADQISGTVTTVSGDVVTIAVASERLPGVGDMVQVFGTVPGLDSEVLIGRGKITEARNGTILAKIDARGKLVPGQKAMVTPSQSKAPLSSLPPTEPPRIISDISGVLVPTPPNAPPAEMPPPSTTDALEIRGRVSEVLAGTATVQIDGRTMPSVGDKATFVRTQNSPDVRVALVGRGTIKEVLGGEVFVELGPDSVTVTTGDEMRIAIKSLQLPPTPQSAVDQNPPVTLPATLPGSLPYMPTRLEWLAVELNAFARIQTLATERFTLMFTPRPTDDTIVIYVRYLPNVNQNDLRGAIREARNIINILTQRHGWDRWVSVVEDVAAM